MRHQRGPGRRSRPRPRRRASQRRHRGSRPRGPRSLPGFGRSITSIAKQLRVGAIPHQLEARAKQADPSKINLTGFPVSQLLRPGPGRRTGRGSRPDREPTARGRLRDAEARRRGPPGATADQHGSDRREQRLIRCARRSATLRLHPRRRDRRRNQRLRDLLQPVWDDSTPALGNPRSDPCDVQAPTRGLPRCGGGVRAGSRGTGRAPSAGSPCRHRPGRPTRTPRCAPGFRRRGPRSATRGWR